MRENTLEGRRALVTGATGGLGSAIARALAPRVGAMVLTGRRQSALDGLRDELRTHNPRVLSFAADLSRDPDLDALIDFARREAGGVDVLINSAGVFPLAKLSESSRGEFDACFALNVRAAFSLCHAFASAMAQNRWGRIVNIASSSAYAGFRDTAVYCSSKHALLGLSRALHDELKGDGLRVICVSPGSIKTDMGRQVRNQDFETFLDPEEIARFVLELVEMNGTMISEEVRLNRMVIR